jgi:phosphoribosylglycinamide formyltransferase-1
MVAEVPALEEDMIALITYDHPHRKTQDVLWRLLAAGHRPEVIALSWVDRKQRNLMYAHRPAERNWPCNPLRNTNEICEALGIPFHRTNAINTLPEVLSQLKPEAAIVGGAGILPKEVVCEFTVLNVHPGLLPARRGLDVLKWSIHDGAEVGVTAHICDERTDLGRRLVERTVPVYHEDTFHAFAMRQYEYELDTLSGALKMVLSGWNGDEIHPGETKPYRRMPRKIEATLMQRFEDYKRVYAK